ncbi:MAG: PP2C family protein-serine/threonine phosphatase [Flammeovirgaceae bacterium]
MNYEGEISYLKQQLASKENLLTSTREYADNLLAQVNNHLEALYKSQEEVVRHNKILMESLGCASHVLSTVMTPPKSLAAKYVNSFIISKPRDVIGGDFFWMHSIEHLNFLVIADCTGHGVSGALISLMAEMMLRQVVIEQGIYDPKEILQQLDDKITGTYTQEGDIQYMISDLAMDMLVVIHNERSQKLSISSAHMPFFMLENGEIQRVKGTKYSVGVSGRWKTKQFTTQTFDVNADSKFYFFSDGYADQWSEKHRRKLGRMNFQRLIQENVHEGFDQQKDQIIQFLDEWKADYKQLDDIMVIGIDFFHHN